MQIVRVLVEGKSDAGPFSGFQKLEPGLYVISGPNRFGKSIVFAAIAWCLGVEHIYGVQANDPSIFADAVRTELSLDGHQVKVSSAVAEIELLHPDGKRLVLRRSITSNPDRITFDDGTIRADLITGRTGAMSDEKAGFQANFRSWAGFPEARLVTSRGTDAPLYLENLAPLFLIEQVNGWIDIQSEQVYRYGQREVSAAAFEYVLGLDETLRKRLEQQQAIAAVAALKTEAKQIKEDYNALLQREGWVEDEPALTIGGTNRQIVARWEQLDLREVVREVFNFDGGAETKRLNSLIQRLRVTLTMGRSEDSGNEVVKASAEAVGLKKQRHEYERSIALLLAQKQEQKRLLDVVGERLHSAKSLLRLKKEGIGILPKAECPTCHQVVDPADLHLSQQTADEIDTHITQLDNQKTFLANNVNRISRELAAATGEAQRVNEKLAAAERAVSLINDAVGPEREALVQAANDLVKAQRELDRTKDTQRDLDDLQGRISRWVERARDVGEEPIEIQGDNGLLRSFTRHLQGFSVALGCAGVQAADAREIGLDEHYIPTLRGRLLRSFGSASDRARMILAYVLALAEVGKHHPGFVVLDEPLQQNPDPLHHDKFVSFLAEEGRAIKTQVIVFTSLLPNDLTSLRQAGVTVREVAGKFLNLNSPA